MRGLVVSGLSGVVSWGYHEAASVGKWSSSPREAGGRTLTAEVVKKDVMAVSQRPLTFVVRHKNGTWRWPIQSLEISGATLTAVLGPKE